MSISINANSKFILYADNNIMFSHKNPEFISQNLGKELESRSEWLIDNKLSLHISKSESRSECLIDNKHSLHISKPESRSECLIDNKLSLHISKTESRSKCFIDNKLSLHISKTEYILLYTDVSTLMFFPLLKVALNTINQTTYVFP
jgi:c-di-GMP-related signal transduction protein